MSKVVAVHSQLLETLKSIQAKSSRSLRVGGAFMEYALKIKEAHTNYCSIHPKLVASIEKRRDAINLFMKSLENSPKDKEGSVLLTASLSAIFRRLDKYPALLQELQRYTDEADPDRGDTQRAGFLYREFVSICLEIRRLKEMEIEVMMGNIKNWPSDGTTIEELGQVFHMGPVFVTHSPNEGDVILNDRYLVLFEKDLLLLSVSEEMTSFNFETKFSLQHITLPRLPPHSGLDTFELLVTKDVNGKEGGRFVFQCSTNEDVKTWISQMYQCKKNIDANLKSLDQVRSSFRSQRNGNRNTATGSESSASMSSGCSWADGQPPMFREGCWANRTLMPHAPLRLPDVDGKSNTLKKSLGISNLASKCTSAADDLSILQIIESYCSNGKKSTKQVIGNRGQSSSPVVNRDSEEIDMRKVLEELKMIRKEIKQIKLDVNLVAENLEKEKRARKRLKQFVTKIPF